MLIGQPRPDWSLRVGEGRRSEDAAVLGAAHHHVLH